MEAVFLIIALTLVLMVFAPVAPVAPSKEARIPLRLRLARQLHLWDRYVYHDPRIWYPRD